MAEHESEHDSAVESLMDKITDKIRDRDSSSSSDSDNDEHSKREAIKAQMFRLFGREKPVHKVLGGGKRTYFLPPFFRFLFVRHYLHFCVWWASLIL